MKSIVATAAAALMLAAPVVSFAQQPSNQGPTRAQVIQELVDLESVGYQPARGNDANYPEDIQAAQQRLDQKRLAQKKAATSYGAAVSGTVEAGKPTAARVQ
ncbi:hypothetical protein WS67_21925 [Burkholderia singularis]|uniref:Purine nucleoside phosphorylase n=1 Tax=Burkholderia singularis TaxID=1503053 RepID=A0A118DLX8_9BURK|nr:MULTISPECIES: DUF4148 domain-containing protein [Burkholderia]AOK32083.1 hypothetical protein AQ611_21670 [Burkholderia sp. Bp7605]KVE23872.1 hypothetical protein WS67_21925 [Burkholderia singularis]